MTPTVAASSERAEVVRLIQWRCPSCGWLLFKASIRLADGEVIETRCRGCRRIVTFVAQPQGEEARNA